ncbi:MAG TPA: BON domain-containing protein [Candidatus Polarisedimenticolaceae bacterium]|nr:BON domain-containing protein [Candidatus Polarisedimenticolaceae bacterium]
MRRLTASALVWTAVAGAGASTLDDMDLRSNVEASIRGSAPTAGLHLKIDVRDRVAIPQGVVRDLRQADDVVELASKVKGIAGVDRTGIRLEFPGPGDAAIAAAIERSMTESPRYATSAISVAVDAGVVTLSGTMKHASWRSDLRALCGAVEGVVDVIDRIQTPDTPDARIQKALDGVFGARVTPRFPGRVSATVAAGAVTLEGRVPRLHDKITAERQAWGINGVRQVDNRLDLGSSTTLRVIQP